MTHPIDEALFDLAADQHGLVSRRQVLDLGATRAAWRHRVRRGEWVPLSHGVYRRSGAPVTRAQRMLAAVLDVSPSAYVSHTSAAALWDLPGFDAYPVDVIVLRGDREYRTPLARVHRPRHLPDPFGTVLDGVPVVRPSLLLLQLASRVSPLRLQRTLDRLWSRRLLSGPSVRRELGELMHRGRPGTAPLRELLESLPADYVPPASGLEGRVDQILREAGFASFRRQVDLGDEAWSGRVDFFDDEVPFVLEVDSERYHAALTDVHADVARMERLERDGFTVGRVTDQQVWHHPSEVVDVVRTGRASARRARQRRRAA